MSSGIGRVLVNLQRVWADRVQCQQASLRTLDLPICRNLPFGVAVPKGSDLIFLPQLTGTSALRGTHTHRSLVVVHDIGIIDCPEDAQALDGLTRWVLREHLRSLRFASHIVTVSHFTRSRLLEHFPQLESKTSVIPNAVDDAFLSCRVGRDEAEASVKALIEGELRRPRLVYVGSEIPRKNIGLLLEVLKRIQTQWPEAQLLKVGRAGSELDRQRTLTKMKHLGLEAGKDVIFLQNIGDLTLACAYRSADLFVSASLYEGFGLPAAEALALGLPVVTTHMGSFPEIVGDAGYLVAPAAKSFSEAVLGVLERAPRNAQPAPYTFHSWKRSAESYLDLIEQLVDGQLAL
jgi:glycosyltransferase involved in cell wall biosynthesis